MNLPTTKPGSLVWSTWAQLELKYYSALLEATRAQALELAHRDPAAAFGPLELSPGLPVLDVGCATGDHLRLLAPLATPGAAVGIDLSETLVAHAPRRPVDTSWPARTARSWPPLPD